MNAERSNTIGCYGLRAAMEFLLEVGVERIGPKVQALGDQIAAGVRRARLRSSGRADAGEWRRHREFPQGRNAIRRRLWRGWTQPSHRDRGPRGMGAVVAAFLHHGARKSMRCLGYCERPIVTAAKAPMPAGRRVTFLRTLKTKAVFASRGR